MLTYFGRSLLFLTSYTPLFLILAVIEFGREWWLCGVCTAISVILFLSAWLVTRSIRRQSGSLARVTDYTRRDGELMSYIVAYIIPIEAFVIGHVQEIVAGLLFFLLIGFLYVRANLVHINPVLAALGYYLYEIEADGKRYYFVSRRRYLKVNDQLELINVGENIRIER